MRRLAFLAAVVAALIIAGPAHAATLTLKPQIQGAGTIAASTGYRCDARANVNTQQPFDCPSAVVSGVIVPPVTFTASAAGGEWEFDRWTGCDLAIALACQVNAGGGERTVALVAHFVDRTAPTVQLDPIPVLLASGRVTPSFSTTDPTAKYKCAMDDEQLKFCAPGEAKWSLADGEHTFHVRAVDPSGNESDERTATFTVDTTPPEVKLAPMPAVVAGPFILFHFTSSESASFRCRLNGTVLVFCADGLHWFAAEGTYTLGVTGTDAAGNVGAEATATVRLDSFAPKVTITGGPDGRIASRTATIDFSVSEPATTKCVVDSGAPVACRSPFTMADLADGAHTVQVIADDGAHEGRSDAWRFVVDTTPPPAEVPATPAVVPAAPAAPAAAPAPPAPVAVPPAPPHCTAKLHKLVGRRAPITVTCSAPTRATITVKRGAKTLAKRTLRASRRVTTTLKLKVKVSARWLRIVTTP